MTPGASLRRRSLLLAGSVLAGCAQPAARGSAEVVATAPIGPPPGNAVLPVAMPCASAPNDIAGLVLEGAGSPVGTVVCFGQCFRPGDLPRGRGLAVRLADSGRILRAQIDVPTRHNDGSARFGIVSVELPAALPRGDRLGLVLAVVAAPAAEAPLDLAALLAGRQAQVEISAGAGSPSGEVWRLDLLAEMQRDRGARNEVGGGVPAWQSGPLAVQRRIAVPVPAQVVGGATSLRLVADIAVHADGTLRVDTWFRNDIAMRAGGGDARYTARILLDGVEAFAVGGVRHFHYTAWGRLLAASPGGRPAPPQPFLRPNASYLAETGAVSPPDLTVGVDAGLFAAMERVMASDDWAPIFAARGIARYMPATGGRPDIGPMTEWQGAWLISGDPRAASFIIGQAEASGAIPWHHWDREGGADRRGGWLNLQRWPGFWLDPRGGLPPRSLLQPVPSPRDTGWTVDTAHQPDIAFLPFLMTGRRALLDQHLAQATWNLTVWYPPGRNPAGLTRERGADRIIEGGQVRAIAWAMRQIDEAGWIAPDDDPDKDYLRNAAEVNWAYHRAKIPSRTAIQGEAHGWVPAHLRIWHMAPWQQDFMASTVAAAARRGNADARAVLAWMANFLANRFLSADKGFAPQFGVAYGLLVGPENSEASFYKTWAAMAAAMRAAPGTQPEDWSRTNGGYTQLALQSLAQLIDLFDLPEARRAYALVLGAGPRGALSVDFARSPATNIVPRGGQRFPSRLRACTPAGGGWR